MKRALLAMLLVATPVSAASVNDGVYELYASGRYDEAMRFGEASNSASGLAIAARAALADAMMRARPCLECLKRAEDFARRSTAADAAQADAHVWLATALGYEARIIGLVRARLEDDPGKAKMELDAALKAEPDNAYALAALGGWNIEIVRAGGQHLGKWLYGASEGAGMALFERAAKAAPDNVAVRFQIGLALAGFAPRRYPTRIESHLEAAIHAAPRTAYEKFIQGHAQELLTVFKKNNADALEALVHDYQGYPD